MLPKIEEDELKIPDELEIQPPFWTRYNVNSEQESSRINLPPEITKELVLCVYREVWDEFHTWERATAERAIEELSEDLDALSSALNHGEPTTASLIADYAPTEPRQESIRGKKCSYNDLFLVTTFGGIAPISRTGPATVVRAPEMKAYPEYEFCTPSKTSIGRRRYQTLEHEILSFFPTVENPSFNREEFADEFEWFAWQREGRDPTSGMSSNF